MLWGCVHGVSLSCRARIGRVFGHVGGAHVDVRERLYVTREAKRRERGEKQGRGADRLCICAPLIFARAFTCVLLVVYLCGRRMVVWVAAASPLTVSSPRVMVSPWCAVRPL